ncbi:MAG: PEP-CTERM sorting domain-containing protein [Candidatus Tectimicrobiota bacterium]
MLKQWIPCVILARAFLIAGHVQASMGKYIAHKKFLVISLVGIIQFMISFNSVHARPTATQIIDAVEIAIETQIPGSEFLTLLQGADAIALAAVNISLKNREQRILQDEINGTISGPTADGRLRRLEEIKSRLQDAKNRALGPHKDQGGEPSFNRFISNVSLTSPLPTSALLNVIPASSASFIINPQIWGNGFVNPSVTNGQIAVDIGAEGFSITSLSFTLSSFDVNGISTGPTSILMRQGTSGTFHFDPLRGIFRASYEGSLVNNLYPVTNPITFFSDISGLVFPNGTEIAIWTTSEPAIIPGVPGESPLDSNGMAYVPTQVTFNAGSRSLSFGDNLYVHDTPDIAIVRTASGAYLTTSSASEPLVGAALSINPMQFLGKDGGGTYLFSDSDFSITGAGGILAAGRLLSPEIDSTTFQLTADPVVTFLESTIHDSFLNGWAKNPYIQLLGPVGTAELVSATDGFSLDGTSPTDFENLWTTPEPSSWLLLATGLAGLLGGSWRGRQQAA